MHINGPGKVGRHGTDRRVGLKMRWGPARAVNWEAWIEV